MHDLSESLCVNLATGWVYRIAKSAHCGIPVLLKLALRQDSKTIVPEILGYLRIDTWGLFF